MGIWKKFFGKQPPTKSIHYTQQRVITSTTNAQPRSDIIARQNRSMEEARKRSLAKKSEYDKAKELFAGETDQIIKYWFTFYYLDEKIQQIGDTSVLEQVKNGLRQKLLVEKGYTMMEKIAKLSSSIDGKKLTEELDLFNKFESGETDIFQWD